MARIDWITLNGMIGTMSTKQLRVFQILIRRELERRVFTADDVADREVWPRLKAFSQEGRR